LALFAEVRDKAFRDACLKALTALKSAEPPRKPGKRR